MLNPELRKFLRKYWYVVIILVAILGCLGYVIYHSGKDPVELLREWGYLVILIWTFLEGETIVIIAGWLSSSVELKPWLIALCAFSGSFCSDQVMFSLGKYKGADVLKFFPKVAKNMDKAARLFKKYDTALILGFRFVYGVRNITPIMLGISGVSHKKFFFLNIIGAGVWALTFTYGGLYMGKAFMKIMDHVGHGIFYVIIGLLIAAAILWFVRARFNVKHAKSIAQKCEAERASGLAPSAECEQAEGASEPAPHVEQVEGASEPATPAECGQSDCDEAIAPHGSEHHSSEHHSSEHHSSEHHSSEPRSSEPHNSENGDKGKD